MLVTSIPQYIQGLTNAKLNLTATSATTLFTVPSDADFNAAIVNSILVAEKSGNADTITVQVVSGSDTFILFKTKAVSANTTVELLSKDLILQSGEELQVQAATANRLDVVASIQDLSKTRITTSAITRI